MMKQSTFLQVLFLDESRNNPIVKFLVTAPQPQLQYSLFQQKIEMLQVNNMKIPDLQYFLVLHPSKTKS